MRIDIKYLHGILDVTFLINLDLKISLYQYGNIINYQFVSPNLINHFSITHDVMEYIISVSNDRN